jgi:hypothetical protein
MVISHGKQLQYGSGPGGADSGSGSAEDKEESGDLMIP